MIINRLYLYMGQRCFICGKLVWFFQRWFSTYDNYLYHEKCLKYWKRIMRREKLYGYKGDRK